MLWPLKYYWYDKNQWQFSFQRFWWFLWQGKLSAIYFRANMKKYFFGADLMFVVQELNNLLNVRWELKTYYSGFNRAYLLHFQNQFIIYLHGTADNEGHFLLDPFYWTAFVKKTFIILVRSKVKHFCNKIKNIFLFSPHPPPPPPLPTQKIPIALTQQSIPFLIAVGLP